VTSGPEMTWTRDDVPVVFGDDHLLVVDKPSGLVVHPAPGHEGTTLAEIFAGDLAGGEEPGRTGIVHRLDRGTSGLMLLARTAEAHTRLQKMIEQRELEREYLALVSGAPRTRTGKIDAPIGRSPRERHRMAVDGAGARPAVSHFEVEESLPGASLLRVRLETGRTHQIRVHMKAIGTPIFGDPTYGGPALGALERPFLHSTRVSFEHPLTGQALELESPLPVDLRRALGIARSAGSAQSG
jgi:23S rRNA pseudouridine1911/1915/1917 synthase